MDIQEIPADAKERPRGRRVQPRVFFSRPRGLLEIRGVFSRAEGARSGFTSGKTKPESLQKRGEATAHELEFMKIYRRTRNPADLNAHFLGVRAGGGAVGDGEDLQTAVSSRFEEMKQITR